MRPPLTDALIAYQRKHKISQVALASRLDVSKHWLNDLLAGRRRPYFAFACRAYALGIPAAAILEGWIDE